MTGVPAGDSGGSGPSPRICTSAMRARENPFRSDRIERIAYRFERDTWDTLLERFARLSRRAAIVGPEGTGKTTLLEQTAGRLSEIGCNAVLERMSPADGAAHAGRILRRASALAARDVLLLDGADHLPPLAWLRLRRRTRSAGGLLITSHRAGMLPTLIDTSVSLRTVREVVAELLGGGCPAIDRVLPGLLAGRCGNVRLVLRDLYDLYGRL